MNKKVKILVVILTILILLVGGYFIYSKINSNKINDAITFSEEYTNVKKENVFVYKTGEEIIKILEKGTGIVYLGFPECPWCQAYAPILNEVAEEEGVEKIYYFNIKDDRKDNTKIYQKIVSLLKGNLDYDTEGNERVYVPNVTFILNGKVIGNNNDTSLISDEITPDEYWTNEKKNELKENLRSYILQISDGMCTSCDE